MARQKAFRRTDRLQSQIKEALALSIGGDTDDEALHSVVITDVEVTRDLSLAKVYWHGRADDPTFDREAVEAAFERARGYLRGQVGDAITARKVPDLRFFYDEAIDRGRRIDELLMEIAESERKRQEDESQ